MPVSFYRAVSSEELADIRQCGRLRETMRSCEGKHLASSVVDARRWGEALYGSSAFAIVRITVQDQTAAALVKWERLDGIGPACFATIDQLEGAIVDEVIDEP